MNEDLKAFLMYVAGRKSNNPFVMKVDEAVEKARKSEEWRREYMTLLMRDQENIEKGRAEGRVEGCTEGWMAALFSLVTDGLLSIPDAARIAGMETSEFEREYENYRE